MSTLTLLRHGQAAFGDAHYDQLSALGLAQAEATGTYFRAHSQRFDAIYCGPRQRQRDTALQALGADTVLIDTPALDEFGDGAQILRAVELRTGIAALGDSPLPRRDKLRLYGEQIRLWANDEAEIPGVIGARAFRRGVADWLDAITTSGGASQQLLAVTSAGVIAAIVCELLDLPDREMSRLMAVIDNASLSTLLYSAHSRTLKSFNQTAHLPATLQSAI